MLCDYLASLIIFYYLSLGSFEILPWRDVDARTLSRSHAEDEGLSQGQDWWDLRRSCSQLYGLDSSRPRQRGPLRIHGGKVSFSIWLLRC